MEDPKCFSKIYYDFFLLCKLKTFQIIVLKFVNVSEMYLVGENKINGSHYTVPYKKTFEIE
jgi:hypothetical protein